MRKFQLEKVSTIWFLTLGVTSLAAGILVYILLLESALGAFSIREASPSNIGTYTRSRVALLNSDYTKQAHRALNLRDTSTAWVDQTLLSWREFFIKQERQIPFNDINDEDLEYGDLSDFDVLVLPSTRALSDLQIERIKEYMESGGSVLASWTTGVYHEEGTWRGWGFVEDAFGVDFEGFVERGQFNFRISADTFPGHTPDGLYLPKYLWESPSFIPPDDGGNMDGIREQKQREANRADFPPLQGYVWFDSLNTARPNVDFARAQNIRTEMRGLDGELREQDAVIVTYYTWTGFDPKTQIPYPRTGAGIRRFTIRGNTPLSADIVSGYRVKIQVYNPGVKMSVREPDRSTAAGFWFDFATDDLVGLDQVENSTGLVYGTYGEGRFVYMGFQKNAMGVGPGDVEDVEVIDHYFGNAMNYLRRMPSIWVHDWPHNHDAAAMITGATEASKGIEQMASIADILDEQQIPGTYFVAPRAARPHANILRRLYAQGDVGVYDSLRVEADGSPESQGERLARLREQLERLIGDRVIGYRSTERGILGRNTMAGLVRADYEYFLPDSIGRRIAPKIMGDQYAQLTRIGTTVKGIEDHLKDLDGMPPDLLTGLVLEGIDRVQYEGGLYNLVYDPETLVAGGNQGTIRAAARSLKQNNFWIASGDEIAHWWRLHKNINADVEQRSESRLFVRVSNDNGHTAEETIVSISLGRSVSAVNVRPELINIFKPIPDDVDIPPYRLLQNGTVLELSIKELKPQQYRIFHIDLLDQATIASAAREANQSLNP